ncbi:MAG: tRNA modification GTPase [Candidatus Anammoximicrobium sp.]|nr:tRNA modification GTPase [Candidatus Anammoximicrobium sp.]
MNVDDTIAAVASAPGGAFRGLVRLSGPRTVACLAACFRGSGGEELAAIRAPSVLSGQLSLGAVLGDAACDLYLWPGRRSYTRQPVAELHTIGSPPVLQAALRAVCQAGARPAEPGEFTLRAFLAGRLDLTQAEAVLAVIDAHGQAEFDIALRQLAGGLAGPLQRLRDRLLGLLAHVEAGLDFADEDLEFIAAEDLRRQLDEASDELARLAAQVSSRGRVDEPFRVVLMGWPNVGKSSLMNALLGESAALVSPHAGTTRDYLTRPANLHGLDCRLIDTAGWETGARGPVAETAQALAEQQAEHAHVQLFCLDATRRLNAWERQMLATPPRANRLLVLTKTDGLRSTDLHLDAVPTSSLTGAGMAELRQTIYRCLSDCLTTAEVVAGTAVRCGESLRKAACAVRRARQSAAANAGEELVAAELRLTLDNLAQVVGAVYTEDILDRIFSRFCIGK